MPPPTGYGLGNSQPCLTSILIVNVIFSWSRLRIGLVLKADAINHFFPGSNFVPPILYAYAFTSASSRSIGPVRSRDTVSDFGPQGYCPTEPQTAY